MQKDAFFDATRNDLQTGLQNQVKTSLSIVEPRFLSAKSKWEGPWPWKFNDRSVDWQTPFDYIKAFMPSAFHALKIRQKNLGMALS